MQKIIILTPNYNDWDSLEFLLSDIDSILPEKTYSVEIVIVNDFSTLPNSIEQTDYINISNIEVINLSTNLGHQKAINVGLLYVNDNKDFDNIIVMDSDGEDKPEDINKLLKVIEKSPEKIIFAERSKRSEPLVFRIFYKLYVFLFYILTSKRIRFGNFCAISKENIRKLLLIPELHRHIAASIIKSKIPYESVECERGKRYRGESKMNFVNLILHGLNSISIYIDVIGVKIVILSIATFLCSLGGITVVGIKKYILMEAIPGWASTMMTGLILVSLQSILIAFFMTFIIISLKSTPDNFFRKNFKDYIESTEIIK